MTRSRFQNKYLKNPNKLNKLKYNKQRNYCVNLLRKEKRKYYNNLDVKLITDNKQFWKTMKPFFSDKNDIHRKITLIDSDEIISDDANVAEKMNKCFTDAVSKLNITGYKTISSNIGNDNIYNSIQRFKDHPSILKIKQRVHINEKFTFSMSNTADIASLINNLNINKPTTCNNITAKIIVDTIDICLPIISRIYNDSISSKTFPGPLKIAGITPVHKKDETTSTGNYRPVSILPSISKIFERNMYNQISTYIDSHLSKYLCGFRKGYSTQQCLIVMLEKWKKEFDNHNTAGALLTDLSKAFDCLNHELLIAKLEAYGFDHESLAFIYSYLSDRKQRTKVNNSFSSYSEITTGIPQGSIIGPLLFNIYINNIFYFVSESNLTNYADDNTPYAIDTNIDTLITKLVDDTSKLVTWFNDNYFKMNAEKCKLLITNHADDISAIISGESITCRKSVKLFGINIDNKLDFNIHISGLCKKVKTAHSCTYFTFSMY